MVPKKEPPVVSFFAVSERPDFDTTVFLPGILESYWEKLEGVTW